ncbi:unnamed protein product [Parnassius mnemosyne]|uniref:Tc1-like transposase DDE domain-containing protein n=1 Tax=Parnassius mnemosyne TaxID=213953 RepID=A0AAV1L0G3_9NEOP
MFNNRHWVFQQDSAPAHRAKSTQDWLAAREIRLHPARKLALLQSRFESVRLQDMATLGGKGVLKAQSSSQFGVTQDILD